MSAQGLVIGGLIVPVAGLHIDNQTTQPWARLSPGDYGKRKTSWVRQIVLHGTRGGDPQIVLPGAGKGGRDKNVAEFWRGDPVHSAAHLVVDTDGSVACLADLATDAAYHATVANDWSIGIEMAQVGDNELYEATIVSTVKLVKALCELMSIPFQIPIGKYNGEPLKRLLSGGRDFAGVYGHRDNTSRRGRGDPGDAIYMELELAGAERFDLDAMTDISAWKMRQKKLGVIADGIPGPATMARMQRMGLADGRAVDAA